ncbi:MAG: DUF86 domain-containing protein [Armatimonadetes bacterium]|nr:DUF86 domain-containing protein [Armatimonadota bacterium]
MSIKAKYAHLPPLPEDISERLESLTEILKRHPVRLAYLFGSSVRLPEKSEDIDFAVLPGEGFSYTALYADISLALKTDRIDLVDMRFAPSYLLQEIFASGKCIYARSQLERFRFEAGKNGQWREERLRIFGFLREENQMGLRKEFVIHAVSELERIAQELEKYQGITADAMATNLSLRWTVEHGLLSGLTVIFHIADHILTNVFQRTVETYEGLLTELCSVGVISQSLYQQLRGAGGFRNVLVHEYMEVDLNEVANVLKKAPQVFRSFGKEVLSWLSQRVKEEGLNSGADSSK